MKKYVLFAILIVPILSLLSCQNQDNTILDNSKIVLSNDQKELIIQMEKVSHVLLQLVTNNAVHDELNDIVSKKMYRDDYVPFKDLFYPNQNEKLKSSIIGKTVFETAFDKALISSSLKSQDINLKEFLVANNLAIYVPYPLSDYPENKRIPTITFHPLLNDSVNIGLEPLLDGMDISGYNEVVVNEDYTINQPVYIIVPIYCLDDSYVSGLLLGNGSNDAFFKSAKTSVSNVAVDEVRIGWVYLSKQYDGLFAGGSELRFVHGTIQVSASGQIGGATEFTPCDISRESIRNAANGYEKGFHQCNQAWDTNWKASESENTLAVFEEDNATEDTYNYSAAYTDSTGIKHTGSYSTKYTSNDPILYNLSWDRDWFFMTNKNMQEWIFRGNYTRDGFAYRKLSEHLQITTPHQKLTY